MTPCMLFLNCSPCVLPDHHKLPLPYIYYISIIYKYISILRDSFPALPTLLGCYWPRPAVCFQGRPLVFALMAANPALLSFWGPAGLARCGAPTPAPWGSPRPPPGPPAPQTFLRRWGGVSPRAARAPIRPRRSVRPLPCRPELCHSGHI